MVIFREQISLHVHISIQDGIIFIPHLTENKHLKIFRLKRGFCKVLGSVETPELEQLETES